MPLFFISQERRKDVVSFILWSRFVETEDFSGSNLRTNIKHEVVRDYFTDSSGVVSVCISSSHLVDSFACFADIFDEAGSRDVHKTRTEARRTIPAKGRSVEHLSD